jgi:hypothetical protein
MLSGLQVVPERWIAGPLGVRGGQYPVQEMTDNVLTRHEAIGSVAVIQEFPDVIPAAVGVADQR